MKIRIKDDSIRLRLTQTEVNDLVQSNKVNSQCQISFNSNFCYEITTGKKWLVTTAANTMQIEIPKTLISDWDINKTVGFETLIDNGSKGLKVLIEKDFKCLTPRNENEEDHYENPLNQHNC
jgi:hypothetical protein